MRLLNVKTRKFEEFLGDNIPPYAIVSHRWGDDEATFQDINTGRLSAWRKSWSKSWPPKLEGCRLQAKKDNLSYMWIDTCCIDKTNSVELGEAINSMFAWYKNSARCYAYLSDVIRRPPDAYVHRRPRQRFRNSGWFTRGWTLQELLAPKEVHFYDLNWEFIGTKTGMWSSIEEITGIPRAFLLGWADLHEASVAQRMSWAANRVTTRKEDVAYCLLGLFGVTMPMIYGEKDQAFVRLQLETMKNSGDHSILAWGFAPDHGTAVHGGVLATSPADFANSGGIIPCVAYKPQITGSFEFLGGSLRMEIPLANNLSGQLVGLLNCGPGGDKEQLVGIPLNVVPAGEPTDNYLRPAGREPSLFPRSQMQDSTLKLICIRRDLPALQSELATQRSCFYIDESAALVKLVDVVPKDRWMKDRNMITTSYGSGTDACEETFLRFRPVQVRLTSSSGDDFVVVLVLKSEKGLVQGTGHLMVLSQQVPLADLAKDFKSIEAHLYGQQSGSNGEVGVSVSVKQETVARQGIFVVKLTALAKSSGAETGTANATPHLSILRLEREQEKDVARRRELQLKLENTTALLKETELEEAAFSSAASRAQELLDDAQNRVRIAKAQVKQSEKALKDAQYRREDAENGMLVLKKQLQQLQLPDYAMAKTVQFDLGSDESDQCNS